jgi:hypothetical protein
MEFPKPKMELPEPERQEMSDGKPFVCDLCEAPIDGEGWFQRGKPNHPGCWVACYGEG